MTIALRPIDSAIDRAEKLLREGKIRPGSWDCCALSAMFPECGEASSASACPADALWTWLAYVLPWMTDSTSGCKRKGYIKRFYALARNLHRLPIGSDRRIRLRWQHEHILPMARAVCPADSTKCLAAIDYAIELHSRELSGKAVTKQDWLVATGKASKSGAWMALWAVMGAAAWAAAEVAAVVATTATKEKKASDTLVEGLLKILESETAVVMR